MAPCPGRRDGVPLRLFESQGTTSRCRCFLSMAPGLKHSGKGAVRVRGVDHQAGGVCRGYRRSRLLEPPLVIACLNGDKGPRGVSLDYPLGIAWRRHRFDPLDCLSSIRVAALREDRVSMVDMHDRKEAAIAGFGYEAVVLVDGLNGATVPVATIWIIQGEQPPRLVSTWVDIP